MLIPEKPHLIMRFEGAWADNHQIGMRHLGESLIGLEYVISNGLYVIDTGAIPTRTAPMPIAVRTSEPIAGSFDVNVWLTQGAAFMPVLHETYLTGASDILWRWISGVLLKMSGRNVESDNHISELLAFLTGIDERRHREIMELINGQKLQEPSKRIVTPVGHSCDQVTFPHEQGITEIDAPTADAIRSKGKLQVGDMETMALVVDGYTHHNKQLKVVHPEVPGKFITAYVRDPAFDHAPNIYTETAARRGTLVVDAKPIRRKDDGMLQSIYILNVRSSS